MFEEKKRWKEENPSRRDKKAAVIKRLFLADSFKAETFNFLSLRVSALLFLSLQIDGFDRALLQTVSKVSVSVRWCVCVTGRCFCSFLPEPPAAGGGDVVVSAAGVDGCLDFRLAALWRNREEGFFFPLLVSQCDFPLGSGNATRHRKKQPH